MRQEVLLHGTTTAPSTARRRGDWRCEGVIHDDEMVHVNWRRDGVHNGKWLRRCDGVDKWLRVIRIGDWGIKIKGENVSSNLDLYLHTWFVFCHACDLDGLGSDRQVKVHFES